MSTRPKINRRILLISGLIIMLFSAFIIIAFIHIESQSMFKQYWKVVNISIDGEEVIDNFSTKSLTFFDNNKLLLPAHKESKISLPLKYSQWDYKRRGFFDGIIEIKDFEQSIFNGVYEVEILDHSIPKKIKLSSFKVDIYLEGIKGFTLENQTN